MSSTCWKIIAAHVYIFSKWKLATSKIMKLIILTLMSPVATLYLFSTFRVHSVFYNKLSPFSCSLFFPHQTPCSERLGDCHLTAYSETKFLLLSQGVYTSMSSSFCQMKKYGPWWMEKETPGKLLHCDVINYSPSPDISLLKPYFTLSRHL